MTNQKNQPITFQVSPDLYASMLNRASGRGTLVELTRLEDGTIAVKCTEHNEPCKHTAAVMEFIRVAHMHEAMR
jgi:hypothetical protein